MDETELTASTKDIGAYLRRGGEHLESFGWARTDPHGAREEANAADEGRR